MVAQRKEIGVSLEHSLVKLPRFFFWEQWIWKQTEESLKWRKSNIKG
jgi:hypothetical protein